MPTDTASDIHAIHISLTDIKKNIAQHELELTAVVETLELAVKTIELQGQRIEQLAAKLP